MTNESENQLVELEAHLAGTLKPVTPPSELVQRMRERIRFPQPHEIRSRIGDWNRLFLIYSGVMSGLLVIITVARAFFYFYRREW
jgi:hypothetical protein